MPVVWRVQHLLADTDSGLAWSLTNHRDEETPADVFAALDTFNTALMGASAVTIYPLGARISRVDLYRDMSAYETADFASPVGQIAGLPTEISSALIWKGQGTTTTLGASRWYHHGISETLIEGYRFKVDDVALTGLDAAAQSWYRQYRPVATAHFPVVDPPQAFTSRVLVPQAYSRRLGRPIIVPGQQRSYLRTHP